MPTDLTKEVAQDRSIRLIVRYSDAEVDAEIHRLEKNPILDRQAKSNVLALKVQRFHVIKENTILKMNRSRFKIDRNYSHLPMNVVTVKGEAGLFELLAQPTVVEVYRDAKLHHFMADSAPLIRSADVSSQTDYNGSNSTVVVLDTGVNYTLSDFGSCTSPGVPAGCRVKVALDIATEDNALDAHGHGTNVSAIVANVVGGAQLVVFDVFDNNDAFDSVIIAGINWAIANQISYNISAINMSLGDPSENASLCSNTNTLSPSYNPFVVPIANAYSAGIFTVIASGNSGYSSGLSMPACTPKAISVGAVYDSNLGGLNWGICTDNSTFADKITCFSNSASYLTLLAPGALISAGGFTFGGTSQATPQVTAAIALLRSARPTEPLSSTLNRLTSTGVQVADPRNGRTFPRIDLLAALGSVNDNLTGGAVLLGETNQTMTAANAIASTQYSTKETGEPNHAGNSGGKSVWFQWLAPASGVVHMNTHGSSFNTLLAAYTGNSMDSLLEIVSNDDDSANGNSGVSFVASANTSYKIAVDGYNGTFGKVVLNLSLDANTNLASSAKVPLLTQWSLLLMALGLACISIQIAHGKFH